MTTKYDTYDLDGKGVKFLKPSVYMLMDEFYTYSEIDADIFNKNNQLIWPCTIVFGIKSSSKEDTPEETSALDTLRKKIKNISLYPDEVNFIALDDDEEKRQSTLNRLKTIYNRVNADEEDGVDKPTNLDDNSFDQDSTYVNTSNYSRKQPWDIEDYKSIIVFLFFAFVILYSIYTSFTSGTSECDLECQDRRDEQYSRDMRIYR